MHDNTFSYFDLFFTKMLSGMVSSYKKRNIHKQRQCVYDLNNGDYEMDLNDVCLT